MFDVMCLFGVICVSVESWSARPTAMTTFVVTYIWTQREHLSVTGSLVSMPTTPLEKLGFNAVKLSVPYV